MRSFILFTQNAGMQQIFRQAFKGQSIEVICFNQLRELQKWSDTLTPLSAFLFADISRSGNPAAFARTLSPIVSKYHSAVAIGSETSIRFERDIISNTPFSFYISLPLSLHDVRVFTDKHLRSDHGICAEKRPFKNLVLNFAHPRIHCSTLFDLANQLGWSENDVLIDFSTPRSVFTEFQELNEQNVLNLENCTPDRFQIWTSVRSSRKAFHCINALLPSDIPNCRLLHFVDSISSLIQYTGYAFSVIIAPSDIGSFLKLLHFSQQTNLGLEPYEDQVLDARNVASHIEQSYPGIGRVKFSFITPKKRLRAHYVRSLLEN